MEEHKKHIKIVSKKNGIILSPKKIEVEKECIEFFGLVLNQTGFNYKNI